MVPSPGNFVPNTVEIKPPTSIPWAILSPNIPSFALTASICRLLKSPVIPANPYTSNSDIVFEKVACCPIFSWRIIKSSPCYSNKLYYILFTFKTHLRFM